METSRASWRHRGLCHTLLCSNKSSLLTPLKYMQYGDLQGFLEAQRSLPDTRAVKWQLTKVH